MPQYRLQIVLEMKERAEEAAKEAFGQAMRAVKEAQDQQKRMEDDLARRKAERAAKVAAYLQEALSRGAGANAFQNMHHFERRLRDEEDQLALDIEKQKEVVAQKQAEAEVKRGELAEATKEKKAIEKHKEKWQKDVKHQRDVRDENNQDEIGNALFLARQRDTARRSGDE